MVEGRHGDPFAVLGMHEADGALAAARVRSRRRRGRRARRVTAGCSCALDRRRRRGLLRRRRCRAGPATCCARRTREATWSVDDPYAYGPVLGPLDDCCSGRASHPRLYDQLGAHLDRARGRGRRPLRRLGAERAARVGRRRFQRLGWPPARDAQARRHAACGRFSFPGLAEGALYKYEIIGADGEAAAAQGRSGRLRRRAAAGDRLGGARHDAISRGPTARGCAHRAQRDRAARADVDLRSASRLVAARRGRPLARPTTSWPIR